MQWQLCYAPNSLCKEKEYLTVEALTAAGYPTLPAAVPGNFELDLAAAGVEKDLFWSTNTLNATKWEHMHVWYFTAFDAAPGQYLHFGGIDTVADIILNGRVVQQVENMFLEYDIDAPLLEKGNQLIVRIRPAVLEARKYPLPAAASGMSYGLEGLYIRKAPHAYGWDIMPRIVSCGLWRPVELRTRPADGIDEVFLFSRNVQVDAADPAFGSAELQLHANLHFSEDDIGDYTYRLTLADGTDAFSFEERLFHSAIRGAHALARCRLWWPKNAGAPHLYRATLQLLRGGEVLDEKSWNTGIRRVELERTEDCEGPEGGEFVFRVNGKKIFILGTNWVPLDAFHSRDEERLPRAMELVEQLGCNMIRCWGGNVYGSESFYDYCDAHGILVWQDFAMGCGVYPMEERFYALLRQEVEQVAKRLRGHASLALWAGDNECDMAYVSWWGEGREPARYAVTRRVIPEVLETHDFTRPYLPSSPYIARSALLTSTLTPGVLPEDHLWGPRDYFKGEYYTTNQAHFASETGYHGCPSPDSLRRFLAPEALWPVLDASGNANADWLTHAACMEPENGKPFSYRIPLMASQVETLFGRRGDDLDEFARMSQISQAEAKKFFIERFRMDKWDKTGIIWWNLLDGWPQISDAVVDYYYTRKLAWHYIRRSQQPVCLMLSEPDAAGVHTLYGVNDLPCRQLVRYTVTDVTAGAELARGSVFLAPDGAEPVCALTAPQKHMLQFSWELEGGEAGSNHYYTALKNICYEDYIRDMKKCGYDEWEGFES